jgi:hypothetical protein
MAEDKRSAYAEKKISEFFCFYDSAFQHLLSVGCKVQVYDLQPVIATDTPVLSAAKESQTPVMRNTLRTSSGRNQHPADPYRSDANQ